jgi:outer membrane receptor protein involved in Fe transport
MQGRSLTWLTAALSAALLAATAPAQVTTATFYGVVRDPSGAIIPGGLVTLIRDSTQTSRQQQIDATGEFAFQFLAVGSYTLRIEAPGFKTFESRGLELRAAQQARQSFVLELGNVTERIVVKEQTPLVNAVTAEQRESISMREVAGLPVARRNLANVMSIGTGIADTGLGQFAMNGLGKGSASYTMDGIDASANPQSPQILMKEGHNYISVVSMEAVEEVQVSKGVFSAEYGRALGGNINVITRSGANQWHGSLFHLFNSEELNARSQFLVAKPGLTFNQFGGSLGGPIVRDRAFIFGAYEGYRERSFATVQGNVPTQRLRNDMLARFPEYKLLLDHFPLPSQPTPANLATGLFVGAASVTAQDNHAVIKPDVWLNSKAKLSATYVRSRPNRVEPRLQPANARRFVGLQERVNTSFTYIGGPAWSAESRFGYNKNDRDRIDGWWDLLDPITKESKTGGRRLPGFNAIGMSVGGELNFIGAPHRSFEQKLAWTIGRHSLKLGGLVYAREFGSVNIENPNIQYQNEAELIANIPTTVTMTFGRDDADAKAKEIGFYVQDDWRVTPRLTLNLGLRYDYFSNFTAGKPGDPKSPPHVFNPLIRLPDFQVTGFRPVNNPYDRDGFNLGPRFGFAYNPDGQSKTVIRGGFAALYTPIVGEIIKNQVQNSLDEPFRSRFTKAEAETLRLRFPVYNEDVLRLVKGGAAVPAFQHIDPRSKAPYSMNFSLTVERALTQTMALETAFVGTRGVKFQNLRFYNEPNRVTGRRPNPAFATDRYYDNSDSTHYYSWQSSLRRRFSANLLTNLHYTWGKALAMNRGDVAFGGTTIQDFFNIAVNRGRAEGDIAHRFVSDFLYELPGFRAVRRPVVHALFGGWQVSGIFTAQTGTPLNITQPNALQGQRPDLVNPATVKTGNHRETLQYLNRAAFAPVPVISASNATARPGTLGNGAVLGPGLWNLDFSLGKSYQLRERYRVQVRADFFNSLNHTNYTSIDTNIQSARFGRITGTSGARQIQFHMRLTF